MGAKTLMFNVVVEQDDGGWYVYCPGLRAYGAVTQGATQEEALRNINEVVQMIVDELVADGIPLPSGSQASDVEVEGMRVAVIPSCAHVEN